MFYNIPSLRFVNVQRAIRKITNFICDNFNIANYPNLFEIMDVKQLDIENIYNDNCLYKINIRLKEDAGITINNIYDYKEQIETFLGNSIEFEIIDYKNVNVCVLKAEKHRVVETENKKKYEFIPVELADIESDKGMIKYTFEEGEKEGIKICIGEDLENEKSIIDILEGNLLIAGMTGAGKSNLINIILTNIIRTYTKNEVCLFGCDLASADVYYFNKYDNFVSMSTDHKGFLNQLDKLENKIKERVEILNEANCRNAISYNKKNDKKMSYILFIVDELVLLTDNAECKRRLHKIMCNSRKYGIYWILAGQEATKEIIGRCKMNCPQVIGLSTFDDTDSRTIIGNESLKGLKVGKCFVRNKNGLTETQIYFIEEEEMEEILKPYEKE